MEDTPIGRAIARARHRKRWTQQELADALGVAKSSVADWERGQHFPLRNLGAIEEALGISLAGYEPESASS
jgi:transcriptional regulator with XRE-family HTH domain